MTAGTNPPNPPRQRVRSIVFARQRRADGRTFLEAQVAEDVHLIAGSVLRLVQLRGEIAAAIAVYPPSPSDAPRFPGFCAAAASPPASESAGTSSPPPAPAPTRVRRRRQPPL